MQQILVDAKKEIRKFAISKRNEMAVSGVISNISLNIVDKIRKSDLYRNSKHIAIYIPIKNEVNITRLLSDKNKVFYIPRCNNLELEFCQFQGLDTLIESKWGIMEPQNEKIDPQILDLIYIPALAVNQDGYRIGYGKGFYDRFFSKNNLKAKKIIVIPNSLILNFNCVEKTDIQCDLLMHE